LYFFLDVFNSTVLPSGEEEPIWANIGGIPGERLNFRLEHENDKERGTVLSGGLMNFKASEMIKADPFGVLLYDAITLIVLAHLDLYVGWISN
jgi:hypothetical protein